MAYKGGKDFNTIMREFSLGTRAVMLPDTDYVKRMEMFTSSHFPCLSWFFNYAY
ncbi:MAG: hypothetical protein AAB116_22630 [Candidatus Poribacteria bacterium]